MTPQERVEHLRKLFPVGSMINLIEMKRGGTFVDYMVLCPTTSGRIMDVSVSVTTMIGASSSKAQFVRMKGGGEVLGYRLVTDLGIALHDNHEAFRMNILR